MSYKILATKSPFQEKLNKLSAFMEELQLTVEISRNSSNGLLFTDTETDKIIHHSNPESGSLDMFPIVWEAQAVLCDENGNTIISH